MMHLLVLFVCVCSFCGLSFAAEGNWDEVTYLRKKQPQARPQARPQVRPQARNQDQRQGAIETVSLSVGKLIMKGRMDKGMTQKELATKINEKPQVINDYEAGRAVPNLQILSKVERVIGIKLRGDNKGRPIAAPGN